MQQIILKLHKNSFYVYHFQGKLYIHLQFTHIEQYISTNVYGFSTLVTLFVPLVKDVHVSQK